MKGVARQRGWRRTGRVVLVALGVSLPAGCSGEREPVALRAEARTAPPASMPAVVVPAQYPMRPLTPAIRAAHIAQTLEYRMRRVLKRFEKGRSRLPPPDAGGYREAVLRLLDETEKAVLHQLHPREFPELEAMRAHVRIEFDRAHDLAEAEATGSRAHRRPQAVLALFGGGRDDGPLAVERRVRPARLERSNGIERTSSSQPSSALGVAWDLVMRIFTLSERDDLLKVVWFTIADSATPPRPSMTISPPPDRPAFPLPQKLEGVWRGEYDYEVNEQEPSGCPSSKLDLMRFDGPFECSTRCCRPPPAAGSPSMDH